MSASEENILSQEVFTSLNILERSSKKGCTLHFNGVLVNQRGFFDIKIWHGVQGILDEGVCYAGTGWTMIQLHFHHYRGCFLFVFSLQITLFDLDRYLLFAFDYGLMLNLFSEDTLVCSHHQHPVLHYHLFQVQSLTPHPPRPLELLRTPPRA